MNFKQPARALEAEIAQHRHWLHRHAELSFQEAKTTQYLIAELEKLGIPVTAFSDYHGCIGHIKGAKPGKTVLLRADIDALPTVENSGVDYASEHPGVMHACGHDCHTAMLLGAAKLLKNAESELCGNVELLFQSAEEAFTGSHYYMDKGYLNGVDAAYGMHVWPGIPEGSIDATNGRRMASCDNFVLTVHGVSAHGSTPQYSKDAIVAASSIIMNLQTLVSRFNDPRNPLVITVGTIKAGTQFNIITDTAVMEGTIRTFDQGIRKTLEPAMRKLITETAEALGCTAELEYHWLEEPVINAYPELTEIARSAAAKVVGEGGLVETPSGMGSEDFGYIMDRIPSVFAFMGVENQEYGATWSLHSDKFRVSDTALPIGAAQYAQFACDYLEHTAKEGAQ